MVDTVKLDNAMVYICRDKTELGDASAREFVRVMKEAINARGRAAVALSGGKTPQILFNRVLEDDLRSAVDWSKVHFFVGDERAVPLDSNENNFGNAQRSFLSKLNLPETNLHPLQGQEKDFRRSADDYAKEIKEFFQLRDDELPRFDMIHLGMGPDGHCASLFPGTTALQENSKLVVGNRVDKLNADRITFTFPVINNAGYVMFMVEGAEKAPVLAEALQSKTKTYPVQQINPQHGRLEWFVDESAARDLKVPNK